jgi:2-polyprenyl-3-methyl-5-hydroxy-6-metoxy-1,4-benzoquinol methylase
MVPEFHRGVLMYAEHITRYESAIPLIKNKTVLDIASGSGYGSHMMAGHAKHVIGVDLDNDAIDYAKKTFALNNLEFKQGSGTSIPLEADTVDVVVTFETIEHIEDYAHFMSEISRVLKPDGVAIISTPNDVEFPEGAHFHVHEFEYAELLALVKKNFKNIDQYFQATWRYVAVGDEAFFKEEWDKPLRTLNLAPINRDKYLYFYLVCSNKEITTKLEPLGATGPAP